MAVATSQTIIKYHERYKSIDVTFTKEVIKATGLVTQQVYLKCLGETWPCVVYATSFEGAKVIVNAKSGLYEKIQRANNLVSLRFSFRVTGKTDPLMFFVSARAMGYAPYGGSQDVAMLTIQYTQRPPDDLIEIMGRLLDANVNSQKRREERILVTPEVLRKIGIVSKETVVFIDQVPRRCIIRDISFSGCKLIMVGIAKFLTGKQLVLRLDLDEPREVLALKGTAVRAEDVEGRKELIAIAVHFDEAAISMSYKMRINDYLSQVRIEVRTEQNETNGAS